MLRPFSQPPVRNLMCYILPVVGRWEWLVDKLLQHRHLFNGRIAVTVATSPRPISYKDRTLRLAPPSEVQARFGDFAQIKTMRNSSNWEWGAFPEMLKAAHSPDKPNEITLYCHAKGVTHDDASAAKAIRAWSYAMIDTLLDMSDVEWSFGRGHDLVGAIGCAVFDDRIVPAGSFYWFRDQIPPLKSYIVPHYTTEVWPGEFDMPEFLLGSLPRQNRPFHQLYTQAFWDEKGKGRKFLRTSAARKTSAPGLVTLVTPTGNRPEAFALCEKWISQQDYPGEIEWVVVDDGQTPTQVTQDQHVIRRRNTSPSGVHTLPLNLKEGLKYVNGSMVLVIEDDEYYPPDYVSRMVRALRTAALAGERFARYYNVRNGTTHHHLDHEHSSLCRTGFRRELIQLVIDIAGRKNPSIDIMLWKEWRGSKTQWYSTTSGAIGIKGLPGRASHNPLRKGRPDFGGAILKQWIPQDYREYLPFLQTNHPPPKNTHYSVIVKDYDPVRETPISNTVESVLVSDRVPLSSSWRHVRVPRESPWSQQVQSRYFKINACRLFPDSEWVLYTDGQLQLKQPADVWFDFVRSHGEADLYLYHHQDRDCIYQEGRAVKRIGKDKDAVVDRQIHRYKKLNVPRNGGLYLGGIIIRRVCPAVEEFESVWWEEVLRGSFRDQISLPFALAESGVNFKALPALSWTQYLQRYDHGSNRKKKERR